MGGSLQGDFAWRTYEQVYADMQAAAKGVLQLEGIQQKRVEKKQVVCALLAETSAEWMISAQVWLHLCLHFRHQRKRR